MKRMVDEKQINVEVEEKLKDNAISYEDLKLQWKKTSNGAEIRWNSKYFIISMQLNCQNGIEVVFYKPDDRSFYGLKANDFGSEINSVGIYSSREESYIALNGIPTINNITNIIAIPCIKNSKYEIEV